MLQKLVGDGILEVESRHMSVTASFLPASGALPKSVHTRLGHSGSPKDSAIVGPPQSACTNVVWFNLVRDAVDEGHRCL